MSLSYEIRKEKILSDLEKNEIIKVSHIAELLNVSGETIRRDLDRLDEEGYLKKVYGGAVKTKQSTEPTFIQKTSINRDEKREICKTAASLVEDNDNIIIGHGTTAAELMNFLMDKNNLTIITSSVPVLNLAMDYTKGKVIFLGGELESHQQFIGGHFSNLILDKFNVNKAFLAAGGLSFKNGITDYDINGSILAGQMMDKAEEVIILADHTKFGKSTFAHIKPLTAASMIITNSYCSDEWKEYLEEHNIHLLISEN